jgi:tetratricopeptide (TPR) repeat protein
MFLKIIPYVFLMSVLATISNQGYANDCDTSLERSPWVVDHFKLTSQGQSRSDAVLRRHLTPEMLRLERGNTGTISADLDYTLRHIPNHPIALDLASRLELALANTPERYPNERMVKSADCYFKTALNFTPSQSYVHYIYAIHFHRSKAYVQAAEAYQTAYRFGLNNAEFMYNYGLTLFELARYAEARQLADSAKALNYPFKALDKKLLSKGF